MEPSWPCSISLHEAHLLRTEHFVVCSAVARCGAGVCQLSASWMSAIVTAPGEVPPGVVVGTAVGVPLTRQPSNRPPVAVSQTAMQSSSSTALAQAALYSPLMSKMFARFDLNKDGGLDQAELRAALESLQLSSDDVSVAIARIVDSSKDGVLQPVEWEASLDDRLRAAIHAKLDAETATPAGAAIPAWLRPCFKCF